MSSVTDDRIVDEVVGRLAARFPAVGAEVLVRRVRASLTSFVNPPIRDFLPVLVERRVAQELSVAVR